MADNIFDAQNARRIQNLQQQSVSNVIKINPNLRAVLTRYEDAEVSRLKLLELQRLRNKKITSTKKELLKAVTKRRSRRGARLPKKKKQTQEEPPRKSQAQIELEVEERRAKIKQEEKRLRQQDRFLELEDFRQQREFIANERRLEQRELQRQTGFISGQNRLLADQQIAQFNQAQETFRAGQRDQQRILDRQEQARLEDRRVDLQRRQIDANVIQDRDRQETERRRIDADAERYNADVRRFEAQRDRDIAVAQRQLQDVQERVAREDAFRHRQLQEQQELALRNLAAQQKDNERRHREELNKIQNQRAVDAERAITDRELIQGFTAAIDKLNRQDAPPPIGGVSAQELAANIRAGLRSGVGGTLDPQQLPDVPVGESTVVSRPQSQAQPEPQPEPQPQVEPEPQPEPQAQSLQLSPASSETLEGTVFDDPTTQRLLDIQSGTRRESPRSQLEEAESESSVSTIISGSQLPPDQQRLLAIIQGSPRAGLARGDQTPTFEVEGDRPVAAERGVGRGQGERGTRSPSPESPLLRPNPAPESEGSFSSDPSIIGEYSQNTPLDRAGAGQVETLEEEPTLGGQLVGAAAGAAQATGQVVGGAVAGVAQGIAEQLPTAGQVGAAVGRGGAALVGGVASAVYEGLRGSPRPGEQTGGRLTPRGREVDPSLVTL